MLIIIFIISIICNSIMILIATILSSVYLLPIYLIIKSLISKIELPFKYKLLYFYEEIQKFIELSLLIIILPKIISIYFMKDLIHDELFFSIDIGIDICLLVFYLIIYFMNKNKENKIKNFINNLENKQWSLTKEEIQERFDYIKNIEILEEEKEELEIINNSKIFNNNFYAYIGCKNINQVYLYLNKKYGKYKENWNINFLEINENKLKIMLDNQEIIFYKV